MSSDVTKSISEGRAAANRRNASLSTGPRTLEGKLHSSRNSYRHGLARPLANDPKAAWDVDRLARALAAYSNDHWHIEKARLIAEGYFDLARIRIARDEILWRAGGLGNHLDGDPHGLVNSIRKIARYEQRTRAKLRKALPLSEP